MTTSHAETRVHTPSGLQPLINEAVAAVASGLWRPVLALFQPCIFLCLCSSGLQVLCCKSLRLSCFSVEAKERRRHTAGLPRVAQHTGLQTGRISTEVTPSRHCRLPI